MINTSPSTGIEQRLETTTKLSLRVQQLTSILQESEIDLGKIDEETANEILRRIDAAKKAKEEARVKYGIAVQRGTIACLNGTLKVYQRALLNSLGEHLLAVAELNGLSDQDRFVLLRERGGPVTLSVAAVRNYSEPKKDLEETNPY